MAKYKPEDIRNVVFAGHGGTGKTTLLDEILFATKANTRIGSVKEGNSLLDVAEDEIDGKASIDQALVHANWKGKLLHLFDSPGRSDFLAQYLMALRAVETVIIHVDGYSGIQVNTRKAWKIARDAGKAVAIVITKLDVENVDINKVIGEIQTTFGSMCVPFYVPDTTGGGITKMHSVLKPGDDAPDAVKEASASLMESVVESDEELMMRFLGFGQKDSVGVAEILDTLTTYFPSPADVKTLKVLSTEVGEDGEKVTVVKDVDLDRNTFVAQVIRLIVDDHKGKMAIMRVFSGQVVPGATFHNITKKQQGKFGKLLKLFGVKHEEVDSVGMGEIFTAAKVDTLDVNDTITDGTWTEPLAPSKFAIPMVALAVTPKTRSDESRISQILQRFGAEDPTFRMELDRQTKEMLIYGLSELHLQVLLTRMARKFGVEVDTKLPRISYRETITKEVSDFHRHKKQSGGSGEFAEVHFHMRPYKGDEGDFHFVDGLRGDGVRRQFVPSVEKGCRAAMDDGPLTGSPVIRVEVEFYDGKDHPVDGKDSAFQKAAKDCFKKCFLKASPVLLEPVVNLEVTFSSEYAGEVNQYLSSHRGRISGMEALGEEQILRAVVPLAEVQEFSADLRSMTQGQGTYSMEPAGFGTVPAMVQQKVVEEYQASRSNDD